MGHRWHVRLCLPLSFVDGDVVLLQLGYSLLENGDYLVRRLDLLSHHLNLHVLHGDIFKDILHASVSSAYVNLSHGIIGIRSRVGWL